MAKGNFMKCLVTGANSSIGQYLIEKLKTMPEFEQITLATRSQLTVNHPKFDQKYLDLLNSQSFDKFRGIKYDVIFHLAGKATNKDNTLETNVVGAELMTRYILPPTHRFINASSITVYGDHLGPMSKPWEENHECKPTSLYSVSKLASEKIFDAMYGPYTSIVHARLCANAGYNFTHGLVADIVRKLKSTSEKLELFGSFPGSIKPYSYAGDTALFMTNSVLTKLLFPASSTFNVCPHDSMTVVDIAEVCMKELGIYKQIHWMGEKFVSRGDNRVIIASAFKLLELGLLNKLRNPAESVRLALRDIMYEKVGVV